VKRHFLVDVLGLLLCIVVHAADIVEREGAALVLKRAERQKLPRLQKVLADGGYTGEKMKNEAAQYGLEWEVVKRSEMHKFVVVPKRWVVERSIAWTMNWRSLCRQYDYDLRTTETKIMLSSVFYLSVRLTEPRKVLWEINEDNERKIRLTLDNTTQTS
jgi:transposase